MSLFNQNQINNCPSSWVSIKPACVMLFSGWAHLWDGRALPFPSRRCWMHSWCPAAASQLHQAARPCFSEQSFPNTAGGFGHSQMSKCIKHRILFEFLHGSVLWFFFFSHLKPFNKKFTRQTGCIFLVPMSQPHSCIFLSLHIPWVCGPLFSKECSRLCTTEAHPAHSLHFSLSLLLFKQIDNVKDPSKYQ